MENNPTNDNPNFSTYSMIYNPKQRNILGRLKHKFQLKRKLNNLGQAKIPGKKALTIILGGLILIGIIWGLSSLNKNKNNPISTNLGENKIEVSDAKAKQDLSKEYIFPINNEKGDEISKIKYFIENVEKRDEIVVKGQKAESVAGRIFLIINLKITNEHTQPIQMNTRDYVRVTVNGVDTEMLAPDIHNDPVEIQAISTKYTRLGLPINEKDTNIKLHIGEIKGEKSVVDINI